MEEKIYDRQVTKQSLSFRVVDQQQIERHFTLNELTELYTFEPDLLDDPNSKKSKRPTPILPKVALKPWSRPLRSFTVLNNGLIPPQDSILAQLLQTCKDQIVSYHEHESLLDHKEEEELSEAERRAAWAEFEAEVNNFTNNIHALYSSILLYLNCFVCVCFPPVKHSRPPSQLQQGRFG